ARRVTRPCAVRDAAVDLVRVAGAEQVLDAVDEHRELALHDDPELLVRVRVLEHERVRLEVDHVEHGADAEQRPHADARRELAALGLSEPDDVGHSSSNSPPGSTTSVWPTRGATTRRLPVVSYFGTSSMKRSTSGSMSR